jgi:hypothetical protein
MVRVGTVIIHRSLNESGHALLTHPALVLGDNALANAAWRIHSNALCACFQHPLVETIIGDLKQHYQVGIRITVP